MHVVVIEAIDDFGLMFWCWNATGYGGQRDNPCVSKARCSDTTVFPVDPIDPPSWTLIRRDRRDPRNTDRI